MAAKRKGDSERAVSEAETKLGHLLEAEEELESMLKEVRREANDLVEATRLSADERVTKLEIELAAEDGVLRAQIARDRDRSIELIQQEARDASERLQGLDDAELDALARHVIDLLLGRPGSGGAP